MHSGYRAYSVEALRADPVRAQLRRLQLRHPDHHPAARGRASASWRSRSRPTTATRSATSTACATPGTSRATCVALPGSTRWASATGEPASRPATAYELKESADTLARPASSSCWRDAPAEPHPRPRLLRRAARRRGCTRPGHEVTGVDVIEHARRARAHDQLRRRRPRRRHPRRGRRRLRRRARRRRARARARARAAARATRERALRPGGIADRLRAELRPLVPALPRSSLGRFDYDQRGLLDRGHLRFFTRRSFERLLEREGFALRGLEPVGLPFDVVVEVRARRWRAGARLRDGRPGRRCSATSSSSRRSRDHDGEGGQEERGGEDRERARAHLPVNEAASTSTSRAPSDSA